jgi:hypothetical protein
MVRRAVPASTDPVADRDRDRAQDLHDHERERAESDRFGCVHASALLPLDPVGLATLGRDPVGEIHPLLDLPISAPAGWGPAGQAII